MCKHANYLINFSGTNFQFNINKWRLLQNSGLFQNLSAQIFKDKDDAVGVEVSGYELPSIRFSPEGIFENVIAII